MDSSVLEGVMEAGLKELGIPFEEDTLFLFRRAHLLLGFPVPTGATS